MARKRRIARYGETVHFVDYDGAACRPVCVPVAVHAARDETPDEAVLGLGAGHPFHVTRAAALAVGSWHFADECPSETGAGG